MRRVLVHVRMLASVHDRVHMAARERLNHKEEWARGKFGVTVHTVWGHRSTRCDYHSHKETHEPCQEKRREYDEWVLRNDQVHKSCILGVCHGDKSSGQDYSKGGRMLAG